MLKEPLFSIREKENNLVDPIKTFCNADYDWNEDLPLLNRFNLYKEYLPLFTELFNDGQLENFYDLYFRWNTVQNLLTMDGILFSISDIVSAFVNLIEDKEE